MSVETPSLETFPIRQRSPQLFMYLLWGNEYLHNFLQINETRFYFWRTENWRLQSILQVLALLSGWKLLLQKNSLTGPFFSSNDNFNYMIMYRLDHLKHDQEENITWYQACVHQYSSVFFINFPPKDCIT